MSMTDAAILGLLQGLTEFLPVSSSGHLAIAHRLLGVHAPLFFDVFVHVGTLVATLLVFRQQVVNLIGAIPRLPKFFRAWFQKGHLAMGDDPSAWQFILLTVSTFITGIIGLLAKDLFVQGFSSLIWIGCALLLTGTVLFFAQRQFVGMTFRQTHRRTMKIQDAAWIGLAQGLAIAPGISRSGLTIAAGLACKLDRQAAGEYAFLVSIPAIMAAFIFSIKDLEPTSIAWAPAMVGFLVAGGVGVMALRCLLRWVKAGQLQPFAWYCWIMGAGVLLWQWVEH